MKVHRVGYTYFAIVENILRPEQCDALIETVPDWNQTNVPAGSYEGWKTGVLNRQVGNPTSEYLHLFDEHLQTFNWSTYRFNLLMEQKTHFCNRYEVGHELGWHRDEDESIEDLFRRTPAKRVSVSMFLNDNFKGGEFIIDGVDGWKAKKGMAIFFPSGKLHRAAPVTEGVKYNYTIMQKGERGA